MRVLLEAVQAIAQLPTARPIDRARYAALRHQAACVGYTPDLQALHRELSTVYAIPEALLKTTIADELRGCVQAFQPSPPVSPAYGRVGLWSAEAKLPPDAEADASALQRVGLWSAEAKLPPNAEAALQHSKRLSATPLSHAVGEGLGVRVKKIDIPQQALLHLYARLNHAYRTGRWEPVAPHAVRPSAWRGALGLLGYYLPRLPYTAYKAWAEWRAPIRDGYLLTETVAGDPTVCRADS